MQYVITVTVPPDALAKLEAEYGDRVTYSDLGQWLAEAVQSSNEGRVAGLTAVAVEDHG